VFGLGVFTAGAVMCCWCDRSVYSSAVLEAELPFPVENFAMSVWEKQLLSICSCHHAWTDRFYC